MSRKSAARQKAAETATKVTGTARVAGAVVAAKAVEVKHDPRTAAAATKAKTAAVAAAKDPRVQRVVVGAVAGAVVKRRRNKRAAKKQG